MRALESWCSTELQKFNVKDISFVYLLQSLTNPADVRAHIRQQLGTSTAAAKFADDFITMRTHGSSRVDANSHPSAHVKESATTTKGKKKKKGGKASKVRYWLLLIIILFSSFEMMWSLSVFQVDATMLGFGVSDSGRLLEDGQTL